MLSLEFVAKEYNLQPVLDDINLSLAKGESYSLTAPNGSGKTTLLQIMAGLTQPTRGRVLWDNQPFRVKMRGRIGVVLQQTFLYGDLTGTENLSFYASLYGMKKPKQTADEWVKTVGLQDASDVKVKEYSKGMKQRLSFARALLHQPELLLLDEPFDGLDAKGSTLFKELLAEVVRSGSTVFLVTHQGEDAAQMQHRLSLRYGRLVAAG
ncbi:heme ABC exporter ATP-binding protein CcmA [Alicyclobacillus tolerans]|uniref:heme ABC exporter ATP-binding protein CcmA n=1 Tax=Alicyclobacillus tolerans TaxID=90970 RepID=UPI001F00E4DC|nr:heme ABC exporter ATP-binding protein CcmA [Alicyclobacillus tolerans]MCF8563399.1 heme ABC exporter ATP-binding protein CcmA [Alicyclobacillus tolerans]